MKQARQDVRTALRMQAEEEEEDARQVAGKRKKKEKSWWDRGRTGPQTHKVGKVYKEKKDKSGADARSRAFAAGIQGVRVEEEVDHVKGKRELMLVRMVDDRWETLSWAALGSSATSSGSGSASQRTNRSDLVGEILGASRPSQKPAPLPSGPFRPMSASSIDSQRSSSPLQPSQPLSRWEQFCAPPQNRFRRSIYTPSTTSGIRPLGASQHARLEPDDELSFASGAGKKRVFEGGTSAESTRRGMKMFSGART